MSFGDSDSQCVSVIGGSCRKYHFCRDKSFVATKHVLCRDKSMFAATERLSRQKLCLSRQNIFVATKLLSCQIFVATNTCLSRQMFCRDKHTFVATKDVFCRNKSKFMFVATKVLSRQACFSRD